MERIEDSAIKSSTKINFGHLESIPMERHTYRDYSVSRDELTESDPVVIFDKRALERECLARGLTGHKPNMNVVAVGSVEEWRAIHGSSEASAILLILGVRKVTDAGVAAEITELVAEFDPVPIIIVSDSGEIAQVLSALECGARGFIPTNVGVKVAAEAIALARAGGIFIPAQSVLALREMINISGGDQKTMNGMFTVREGEVVEALRRGKANKIIAYELNLCESTVKVHIRNIMKKLHATNRTEVAYKINDLMS